MKTAYISSALDLIFAAQRFNNHRPYIMAGINPMMNLNSKNEDYIKLKKQICFWSWDWGVISICLISNFALN